uniref:MHC class II beta chain N-terminal domain-containing protein n=1 Tax=Macaca fascicularis TaxID=9541 RepID=A0A7N9CZY7_MACFA
HRHELNGGSCYFSVTVPLIILSSPLIITPFSRPRVITVVSAECHFLRGCRTKEYLINTLYLKKKTERFEADLGKLLHVSQNFGRPRAEHFNSFKDFLERKFKHVDTVCRLSFNICKTFTIQVRHNPKFRIIKKKRQPLVEHSINICKIHKYMSRSIRVLWGRTSQPSRAG